MPVWTARCSESPSPTSCTTTVCALKDISMSNHMLISKPRVRVLPSFLPAYDQQDPSEHPRVHGSRCPCWFRHRPPHQPHLGRQHPHDRPREGVQRDSPDERGRGPKEGQGPKHHLHPHEDHQRGRSSPPLRRCPTSVGAGHQPHLAIHHLRAIEAICGETSQGHGDG